MFDICTTYLVYLESHHFFIKAICEECLRHKAEKGSSLFNLTESLYWVLCLSSCGLIWSLSFYRSPPVSHFSCQKGRGAGGGVAV
jgi:hypothetical protein